MTADYLKNKIKKLPTQSGIYVFKGTKKEHLYIGKANNLKNRVLSYLKTDDIRIKKMVFLAKSLENIATNSDIEALILESQLIKKFRPRFNIVMRDDKQYAFVGFTEEKYPKIFITHQPTKIQNFIGPFTDIGALKTTLRYLRRVFPYCTCRQRHHNPCLNYHIGKCLGYCCLKNESKVTKIKNSHNLPVRLNYKNLVYNPSPKLSSYEKNLMAIKDILTGKNKSVVKNLEKEMTRLAKKGDLEKAIELRNKISNLKRILENARIIKNSDIIKTHRSGLESLLKTSKPIIKIEGYDVSNIQGAHATGAMVVFTNGKPDKNQYRKFKIQIAIDHDRGLLQSNKLPGDTGMLKEILTRRFNHPEWPFPDLIVIDGGKAQLNMAHSVISNYYATNFKKQRAPLIIALAKDKKHKGKKIYISGRKNPLDLIKLSPADKNLLLAIDSEVHRFAIEYYRKLHRNLFIR